jgi:DeoR family fructose operon transcriptional repressor
MADFLRDKPKLVVVTNSITLASKLADSSTQTVMLGGRIRPASLSAVGAKTVADLMDLNADIAFLGANGVSFDGGVTAYDTDEAMVKRTMMANSLERILLVDSGKFGSSYPARFANFDSFDRVVTNFDAEQSYVDGFSDAGVEVALA